MNTTGLGFKSVVLFERPITINEQYNLYAMFLRDSRLEITDEVENKLKRYISYLFALEQINNNGGQVDNKGEQVSYYMQNPHRKIVFTFEKDTIELCKLLLNGLLKYRIVECPNDLEFSEKDVSKNDYSLILSEELFNKLNDLPKPDVFEYLNADDYDLLDEE